MEYPASVVLDWLANYFWPYTRISSMLMVMTVTGARFVSPRIRLYLGLAITFGSMLVRSLKDDLGFHISKEELIADNERIQREARALEGGKKGGLK